MSYSFPLSGYFLIDQKWKLIYSGSKHGFTHTDFHSKCDSVKKTVTIIKTIEGRIFGGYTEVEWSSVGGYKKDDNAFLFCFKNGEYKTMKCINPERAILCQLTYGPIFGTGHLEGGHDLCIRSGCDITPSYSNLGRSYVCPGLKHPKTGASVLCQSYLAGSYNFTVKEIEVYCKI